MFAHAPSGSGLEYKIRWIGDSSLHYVAEKWGIGMGFDAWEWDAEEAYRDVQGLEGDLREDLLEDEEIPNHQKEALKEAREACGYWYDEEKKEYVPSLDSDEHAYYRALFNLFDDTYTCGRIIRPRVVYAHQACRACTRLLRELDAASQAQEICEPHGG